MSLTAGDNSAGFVYYVDDITFTNENAIPPEVPFSTTYADFENGDIANYDSKGCTAGEIGSVAHSGEKSLKLTSEYTYSLFSFKGLDEALKEAVAEGYGKVSFWIYVESDKNITYPVWNLWNGQSEFAVQPKVWTNIVFDITGVVNYNTVQFMSLTAGDNSAGFVYYVDDITFTN